MQCSRPADAAATPVPSRSHFVAANAASPSEALDNRHPEAVALDLGAGLDTRMFRIAVPATVDWYDVDFPEVISARQRLVPERVNAHRVGPDLTDQRWVEVVPKGRPAVIVADGLLAFLSPHDMIALLNRLIDRFPFGEIAFNGYTRFAIWAAKHYHGTQTVADLIKSPGFDNPREPERWNPRLTLVREILLTREPEVAKFPSALRLFTRLAACSTAWSRQGFAAQPSGRHAALRHRRREFGGAVAGEAGDRPVGTLRVHRSVNLPGGRRAFRADGARTRESVAHRARSPDGGNRSGVCRHLPAHRTCPEHPLRSGHTLPFSASPPGARYQRRRTGPRTGNRLAAPHDSRPNWRARTTAWVRLLTASFASTWLT